MSSLPAQTFQEELSSKNNNPVTVTSYDGVRQTKTYDYISWERPQSQSRNVLDDTMKRTHPAKIYVYSEKNSLSKHFWFDSSWVSSGLWGEILPKASQSILPVILSFKQNSWHNPSELYIASMVGVNPHTVGRGFKGLVDAGFPDLKIEKYRTKKGHLGRKFRYTRAKAENEFPFHDLIITSGSWFNAPSISKSLYGALRGISNRFDPEEYEAELSLYEDTEELYGQADWEAEFAASYKDRLFDIWNGSISEISQLAGISRRHFHSAIEGLIEVGLVKESEYGGYLVYLKSSTSYKRLHMNMQVKEKLSKYYDKY